MTHHLQISIDGQPGGVPVHVTPVDVALPDAETGPVEQVIELADLTDAVPGDGAFEYDTKIRLTLKIFGFPIVINLPVRVTAKVVDKP